MRDRNRFLLNMARSSRKCVCLKPNGNTRDSPLDGDLPNACALLNESATWLTRKAERATTKQRSSPSVALLSEALWNFLVQPRDPCSNNYTNGDYYCTPETALMYCAFWYDKIAYFYGEALQRVILISKIIWRMRFMLQPLKNHGMEK